MSMTIHDAKVFLIIDGEGYGELENSIDLAVINFLEECEYLCNGEESILTEITLFPELSQKEIVKCRCYWDIDLQDWGYDFIYGEDIPEEYNEALEEVRIWKYDPSN